jgi:hypothetical protein
MTGDVTPSERAQFLQMILEEHDQVMFELRDSSNAFDEAITSMRHTLGPIACANHAQGRAIDRVIAANKLARTLFNDEDSPH